MRKDDLQDALPNHGRAVRGFFQALQTLAITMVTLVSAAGCAARQGGPASEERWGGIAGFPQSDASSEAAITQELWRDRIESLWAGSWGSTYVSVRECEVIRARRALARIPVGTSEGAQRFEIIESGRYAHGAREPRTPDAGGLPPPR